MAKANKQIDIIDKVLDACYHANSNDLFVMSLMHQYEDRGFLTKKQIEGLLFKAQKHPDIPSGWLATLQATIAKMPTRDKTPPAPMAPPTNNLPPAWLEQLQQLLVHYPQHKRALFLLSKHQTHTALLPSEIAEIEKFHKLLIVGKGH